MAREASMPAGRGLRRRAASAALVVAALGASAALAHAPSALAACPHAAARPHQVALPKLRQAVTCLVNKERARRDRRALRRNPRLELAAERHTKVMLARDCLRHHCPGERGLNHRVRRSGYTKGEQAWRFAEALGYDTTPRQLVKRWMRSKFARRVLLNRRFRDVGIGPGWGAPVAGADDGRFATYTAVVGWRRP